MAYVCPECGEPSDYITCGSCGEEILGFGNLPEPMIMDMRSSENTFVAVVVLVIVGLLISSAGILVDIFFLPG